MGSTEKFACVQNLVSAHSASQAADLPVRAAAPVDYVRVCSAPGVGFFFIPGTDTCLRISGFARFEARFAQRNAFEWNGVTGTRANARAQDDVTFLSTGELGFDARTATEFGTLRSFVRVAGDGGGNVTVNRAFIQFAGLTAGRTNSFFSFADGTGFWGGNLMTANAGVNDQITDLIGYSAVFGAGWSASVSMENNRQRRTNLGGGAVYGGQQWPDLVANINVTQAWGAAQLMGAIHQVRHGVANAAASDRTGWALGAAVRVGVPFGTSTNFHLQGTYADGALNYLGAPTTGRHFAVRLEDATLFPAANLVTGRLRTSKGWSLIGGLDTRFSPNLRARLQAAYGEIDHPVAVAPGTILVPGQAQDYLWWQIGARLDYTIVTGLTVSGDVAYTKIDPKNRVVVLGPQANPTLVRGNTDTWAGRIRIQRDF